MNNAEPSDIIEIDDSIDSLVIVENNNQNNLYSSDEDDYDFKKSKIPRLDDGQHESKASKPEPDERDEEVI